MATFLIIISIELVALFELVIRYPEIVERQLRRDRKAAVRQDIAGETERAGGRPSSDDVLALHGSAK